MPQIHVFLSSLNAQLRAPAFAVVTCRSKGHEHSAGGSDEGTGAPDIMDLMQAIDPDELMPRPRASTSANNPIPVFHERHRRRKPSVLVDDNEYDG